MKKILALLLACSMLFAFAACGGNTDTETTTAAPEETTVAEETTAAEETTIADAAEETTLAAEETTVAEETTTEAAAMPATTEEIVAYFNEVSNGVKANAKSVKHHYSKISLNGTPLLPGWADSLLKLFGGAEKFLDDQLSSNSKGEQVYTGSDIKNKYPVENEAWASKLTAADVKSATCTPSADGKTYTIKVVTVADDKSSTVKHGGGHAPKAFNVVLPGVVNDALGKIPGATKLVGGEAEMNYPSSTAVITVDVATGKVLKAEYDLKWTINFGTSVMIPFTTLDSYTISY